jgi:ribulose-phosphate 3-epimerase
VGKAERVQLDVMDGAFVPTRSLNWDLELRDGFIYEVHVMAYDPVRIMRHLAGRTHIAMFHYESGVEPGHAIGQLRELGFRVYIVIGPETGAEAIEPFLGLLDGVVVMTVSPGRYGAPFLPRMLEKVERIRELRGDIDIEVDGAMSPENVRLAREAGANVFVSGSYVLKSVDPAEAIRCLREAAE